MLPDERTHVTERVRPAARRVTSRSAVNALQGIHMRPRQFVVRVSRAILGLFFVADGIIKLTGISMAVELFDRIGWGQWFRYFTGCLVLVGGICILLRLRWTFYGAVACGCTIGTGALLYAFKLGHDATLPAIITVLTMTLAALTYSERAGRAMPPTSSGAGTPGASPV